VEDEGTLEDDKLRDRRKGEPGLKGPGLRKVYRKGFSVQEGEDEHVVGEVEVEDEHGEQRVEEGERILESVKHETEADSPVRDNASLYDRMEWGRESDGVVARASTPPVHAQVGSPQYDIHDDDNPWA